MARVPGKGTLLKVSINTTLTTISQRTSIASMGGVQMGTVDATDLDSTWMEKIATLPEGQAVTLDINYDPSDVGHKFLHQRSIDGTTCSFTGVYPAPSTASPITFGAIVTGFVPSGITPEGLLKATLTLTPNGSISPTS